MAQYSVRMMARTVVVGILKSRSTNYYKGTNSGMKNNDNMISTIGEMAVLMDQLAMEKIFAFLMQIVAFEAKL